MVLLSETIDEELPDLAKQGVRTRFLGRRDRIDRGDPGADARARGRQTAAPRHARSSGSRSTTAGEQRSSRRPGGWSRTACGPSDVDEEALAARLYAPELGEIDLLIRASGELRISNFLLWELAYAELVFTDTLWPDFDVDDLRAAVDAYAARQRRFGARAAG